MRSSPGGRRDHVVFGGLGRLRVVRQAHIAMHGHQLSSRPLPARLYRHFLRSQFLLKSHFLRGESQLLVRVHPYFAQLSRGIRSLLPRHSPLMTPFPRLTVRQEYSFALLTVNLCIAHLLFYTSADVLFCRGTPITKRFFRCRCFLFNRNRALNRPSLAVLSTYMLFNHCLLPHGFLLELRA